MSLKRGGLENLTQPLGSLAYFQGSGGGGGGGLDADTTTWINQVVTNGGATPSTNVQNAVDALIKSIKGSSNWGPNLNSVLDRLYIHGNADTTGHSATTDAAALTSIVNPGACATPNGSTWVSNTKCWFAGTSADYIDTGVNINAGGFNASKDSCTIGYWSITSNTGGGTNIPIGVYDNTNAIQMVPTSSGGYFVNNITQLITTHTNIEGLHLLTRSGASTLTSYQYTTGHGIGSPTIDTNAALSSVAMVNGNIFVCARNHVGTGADSTFTDGSITISLIGGKVTSTAMADEMATWLKTYVQSTGMGLTSPY